MCFSIALFGQIGCLPSFSGLANRKSVGWLYAHCARHYMSTSASPGSKGTSFREASVFIMVSR